MIKPSGQIRIGKMVISHSPDHDYGCREHPGVYAKYNDTPGSGRGKVSTKAPP